MSDAAVPEVDEAAIAAMFTAKKKKKSKKKKDKKSKKDKKAAPEAAAAAPAPEAGTAEPAVAVDPLVADVLPDYDGMLGRIYGILHHKNPELMERKRVKLKPPQVLRVGTTKTCWANFTEICKMMNRPPEHVLSFVLAELGTTGSIDGSQRLLIRGKYVPKYIESLLRKYIGEYVTCKMCRSLNTSLQRDTTTRSRLFFNVCHSCNSQRSVATIKAGFHAVGRGERRKARRK